MTVYVGDILGGLDTILGVFYDQKLTAVLPPHDSRVAVSDDFLRDPALPGKAMLHLLL